MGLAGAGAGGEPLGGGGREQTLGGGRVSAMPHETWRPALP